MKVVFAGTPDFACPTLTMLLEHAEIVAVLTQPDRPAGRGRQLQASPVKVLAQAHNLQVLQPTTLKDVGTQKMLQSIACDLMVVVAYGLIIPKTLLHWPTYGCVNVHASLLPAWRGAAPVPHAILAGDEKTGVSIMHLDEGMDSGPVFHRAAIDILPTMTSADTLQALSQLGADTLRQIWANLPTLTPEPQVHEQATYAPKMKKQDACIDWHKSATFIARAVRAYQPWPVSFFMDKDQPIKVWQATALNVVHDHEPGVVVAHDRGMVVACAQGMLRLDKIQCPGKKPQSWHCAHERLWPTGYLISQK